MDEYRKRIKRENIWLRIGVVLMLALDVVVGVFWEEIFPDPRTMSGQARAMQSILFFGF